MGFDKSIVSQVIDRVNGPEEKHNKDFAKRLIFVVGRIDDTRTWITGPSVDEPAFVNRQAFHRINVQASCDHKDNFKYCILLIVCLQHALCERSFSKYQTSLTALVRFLLNFFSAYLKVDVKQKTSQSCHILL